MNDLRKNRLAAWANEWVNERLAEQGGSVPPRTKKKPASLVPVSDDASFRRYFRFSDGAEGYLTSYVTGDVTGDVTGYVMVDAPPEHEDNESWVRIAKALQDKGLACPKVHAVNMDEGYLIISDLGNDQYLNVISQHPARTQQLYQAATDALLQMMTIDCKPLPTYDGQRLHDEMNLFDEWFLPRLLEMTIDPATQAMLKDTKALLVASALAQPRVFVHRDYHSRNLMVLNEGGPGILDFQDAVLGPVTYDLVSLYKDCYHRFPRQTVVSAVSDFHQQLRQRLPELPDDVDEPLFLKWFDLMGVQRHLKCAGIFSRLCLRDGKPDYLGDLPLVLEYLLEACEIYDELAALGEFLTQAVMPHMEKLNRQGEKGKKSKKGKKGKQQ